MSSSHSGLAETARRYWSARNKVGLGLGILFGLANMVPIPAGDDDGHAGPPVNILAVDMALGLVTVVCLVIGWRTGRAVLARLGIGAMVLAMITALPGLFVSGVPAGYRIAAGSAVLMVVLASVLILSPERNR